ncbi:MAG TPA: metal ABC transporter permease [Candidatus Limnocylindrales bacterium]|nr:metal ABC transporter permease [Candidatus Limnocylindrales bacterium]
MIDSFVASWPLFHDAYLTAWLLAMLLSLAGVLVVARNQLFLGAAVAQASTLGVAAALAVPALLGWHPQWLEPDAVAAAMAVTFAIGAALAMDAVQGSRAEDAPSGWVFLVGGTGSVLLVAHSPHGLEEVHRLAASSIIGTTALDVGVFAALLLAAGALLWLSMDRLLLVTLEPTLAEALGISVRTWRIALAALTGLVLGLAIRASGFLYTFGSLILPALAARSVCREVRPMFLISPAIALVCSVTGCVLANHYDLPPGQAAVALQCAAVVIAHGGGRLRRQRS